jgi:PAS domain S-box-containing protein
VTTQRAPERPPRLILRFAIYSALALVLTGVGVLAFVRHEEQARAERQALARGERVAERIEDSLGTTDFKRPATGRRLEELDRLFADELGDGLVRARLWSRGGTLVYSDVQPAPGARESAPATLPGVLAGETAHERTQLRQADGRDARIEAFQMLVPVRLREDGRVSGALEIHYDYGLIADDVRSALEPIAIALALAWILLYAALFPILRQVTTALASRSRKLEDQADAYRRMLDERAEVERRLSEAERNYRTLVEQLPLVTYIDRLDETSSSVYMSPQIEGMLGYPVAAWLSDPEFFPKVLYPEDRDRVLAEHRRAYATGRSFSAEYRLVAKDGRIVWVRDEVMVARDASGRPLHAQGFLLDVTSRKLTEDRLERQHAELKALHETALGLIDRLDVDELLEAIALRAGTLVGTTHCYVYLVDPDARRLTVRVGTGIFEENVGFSLGRGEGLAGRVWEGGEPLAVDDYGAWSGRALALGDVGFGAVAGVPLRAGQDVVGVLGLGYLGESRSFGEADMELLSRFGYLASVALEKARLYSGLRESEEQFRTLVSNIPGAIFRCAFDADWTMEYLSDSIEAISGYPAADFIQNRVRSFASIIHPDDTDMLEDAVGEGRPYEAEYRIVRSDGAIRWVHERGQAARGANGELWLDGSIFDVTEQKMAESALRESESKFRSFVETTEEWVWAIDEHALATYSNPAVERILGYRPDELVGRDSLELVHEEDRERIRTLLPEFAARREGWSGLVIRWRHKNGSLRHLESNASPIFDEAGELRGYRGTDRDVTERIRAETERERLLADLAAHNERLLELDELKDEFIALVSHELRTPLTSIRGYVELLREGSAGELNEEQLQFLTVVERNSHRLLGLVGDLLFLAQIEAGKLVLDVDTLDLAALASESVEAARPAAEEKEVTMTLATGPVPVLVGDRVRVAQLLDNLVSNAVKFTPAGGRVDVRVRALDEKAVLEVRDSGIGIPAPEQKHLFERFFRSSNASAQAIQGTGLGLAISKAIVDAHGGAIAVASEEGRGTTFRVAFPLEQHAQRNETVQFAS